MRSPFFFTESDSIPCARFYGVSCLFLSASFCEACVAAHFLACERMQEITVWRQVYQPILERKRLQRAEKMVSGTGSYDIIQKCGLLMRGR
ncbi:hypothetical protein RCCGEPOP_15496 [Rhizobium sp. Pop5]|nr:hypothetical protein RCCGEPOP_15496 [Rhizobium sp. Pop5]